MEGLAYTNPGKDVQPAERVRGQTYNNAARWDLRGPRGGVKRAPKLTENAFGKPKSKLARSGFWSVAAVRKVVVNGEGKVASDRARGGIDRVCRAHHGADRLDRIGTAYRHRDDRSAGEIVADVLEEGSFLMLGVMRFDGFSGGVHQFHARNLEVSRLNPSGDFSNEATADSAWLDEYQSCFAHAKRIPF